MRVLKQISLRAVLPVDVYLSSLISFFVVSPFEIPKTLSANVGSRAGSMFNTSVNLVITSSLNSTSNAT